MERDFFTTLIEPTDLHGILKRASTVVFDSRFSLADPEEGSRLYHEGHIPGAHYLHLDRHLSGGITSSTGRHPLPDVASFAALLSRHGVDPESQVIAYDQGPGAFAARLWWLCKWLGHEHVAVLNGGYAAWQAQRHATDDRVPIPTQGNFQPLLRADLYVTSETLTEQLGNGSARLIDARAPERYRGDVEPIDRVAGHVPSALNVPFTGNLSEKGTFLPAALLAERHEGGETVIHMCGSGVTACHNILASVIAGRAMPRLYAGSWSEWITDPNRPVATGEAPG